MPAREFEAWPRRCTDSTTRGSKVASALRHHHRRPCVSRCAAWSSNDAENPSIVWTSKHLHAASACAAIKSDGSTSDRRCSPRRLAQIVIFAAIRRGERWIQNGALQRRFGSSVYVTRATACEACQSPVKREAQR
jgi:hypothetical protein